LALRKSLSANDLTFQTVEDGSELKRILSLQFNYLGDNEWLLCHSRAAEKTEAAIAAQLHAWRKPFEEGKTANIGSANFASPETWRDIATRSDEHARRALLADSAALVELDRLQNAANEAAKLAEAKQAELSQMWSEYNAIPERIEAIGTRLAELNDSLRELDAEALEKQYKDTYKSILNHALTDGFALVFAAEAIVAAPLRKQVIAEVTEELESELTGLRARSKELTKRLGIKA
jgi:hypothetical protein